MATEASIVIAYVDLGDKHRAAALSYVTGWYSSLGLELIIEAGPEPFSRAAAINAGVRRAGCDIIVQVDPDSLVDHHLVSRAIHLAAARPGLVVPHNRYLYLSEQAAAAVLDGELPFTLGPDDCDFHGPDGLGNVTVFSRDTWHQVRGFDERFGMWGGDDAAFAFACNAYFGPHRRLAGDMWHLWHPRLPQSEPGHPGYTEQFAILAQYRDATDIGPQAVRDLVEARPWT